MLNVQTAHSIIGHITFLIAYGISVTLAGCFTAWVALKMGDETPAQDGFLSLNPLVHIDPLGTLFMVLYNFGWGRFIPINPFNMHGKFRFIKIVLAFFAKSLAHVIISVISLMILIALFGENFFGQFLTQKFPHGSSYLISIGMILFAMIFVNMLLAVITFFVNMCGMCVMLLVEKHPEYLVYSSLIMIIVPVILFYLFGGMLLTVIFSLIHKIGFFLAALLHVY